MLKKSVLIAGQHATSISLEEEFFAELQNIANEQNISLNKLITAIDGKRSTQNLSSAIRLYVLQYYKNKLIPPE
ncbi:MAG: ribbon-helix-helix domain-containing protein [Alphaproteobacteria bacterium]|nr:ribbon-helix-helix domain-containing protein [Alphaproteobacteria bacterium]MBR3661832.1 ribbon-helix-helix domain-containing protein [Alphaproteobacteria bacterium]